MSKAAELGLSEAEYADALRLERFYELVTNGCDSRCTRCSGKSITHYDVESIDFLCRICAKAAERGGRAKASIRVMGESKLTTMDLRKFEAKFAGALNVKRKDSEQEPPRKERGRSDRREKEEARRGGAVTGGRDRSVWELGAKGGGRQATGGRDRREEERRLVKAPAHGRHPETPGKERGRGERDDKGERDDRANPRRIYDQKARGCRDRDDRSQPWVSRRDTDRRDDFSNDEAGMSYRSINTARESASNTDAGSMYTDEEDARTYDGAAYAKSYRSTGALDDLHWKGQRKTGAKSYTSHGSGALADHSRPSTAGTHDRSFRQPLAAQRSLGAITAVERRLRGHRSGNPANPASRLATQAQEDRSSGRASGELRRADSQVEGGQRHGHSDRESDAENLRDQRLSARPKLLTSPGNPFKSLHTRQTMHSTNPFGHAKPL